MKKALLFISCSFFAVSLSLTKGNAQVAINNDGSLPHASAMLDVKSSTKGFLAPRVTTAQRIAIPSPATGLLVYDTDTNNYWYYNGTAWVSLTVSAANAWLITGNAGTNSATNFIGTTDNQPLSFRVNNIKSGLIDHLNKNVLLGAKAAFNISSGSSENTVIGDSALYASGFSSGNTIIGYGAQAKTNAEVYFNTVVGLHAGQNNKGWWITILGEQAGMNNESWGNVFIGSKAGMLNTTGYGTFVGDNAGRQNTTGANNAFFGAFSGSLNVTGNWNTAAGSLALYSNTIGSENAAIGGNALYNNTTGSWNTANGSYALYSNTTGTGNTATGHRAMNFNTSGIDNTAQGFFAMLNNTIGNENVSIGTYSLRENTTGSYNTAVGVRSMGQTTTGWYNNALGNLALHNNTTGSSNVALGASALRQNTTGGLNVAVGNNALVTNVTGQNNTGIGTEADVTSGNLTNATAIGYQAKVNASNKVRIGNSAVTVIEGQVAYTFPSDGRFKINVSENIKGLEFIMKLRPVSYNFQTRKYDAYIKTGNTDIQFASAADYTASESLRYNGFIAQEVEKAAKETDYEFDGVITPKNNKEVYGLSYSQFVVPLVKAVQEQQKMIEKLKMENEELKNKSSKENLEMKALLLQLQKELHLIKLVK